MRFGWISGSLTIHYTVSRYPNSANALPSQPYDESKAKDLIGRAERILGWVERNKRIELITERHIQILLYLDELAPPPILLEHASRSNVDL